MEGRCEWVHSDIELKDMLVCVGAFVDTLILAAGYQSSGEPAFWDPENTTTALQWAVFFENVLQKIPASKEGEQSKQALDMALTQLTSDPLFPKGLPQLSSSTLAESRKLLLGSLLQAVKLTDNQLTAVLTVVGEMDSNNLRYNSKPAFLSDEVYHDGGAVAKKNSSNQLTNYLVQEIIERHAASTCVASLQKGLKVLSDSVLQKKVGAENHIWEDASSPVRTSRDDTCSCKTELWSRWKNNGLLYLLDGKTVSMVSGASLIFSAAKHQWSQVLESLIGPKDKVDECKLFEIVEICFLGLSSRRWEILIRTLMSATYQAISVSKMWHDLQIICRGKSLHRNAEEETIDLERELEEYLLQLLTNRVQLLWKIPPVLVACSLSIRYSCCHQDSHKQSKCERGEIGERIWCLYIFQVGQYNDMTH